MHVSSQEDPSPGSQEFDSHVRCEHNGLSLNKAVRRGISRAGAELLQNLFPDWDPLPYTQVECVLCHDQLVSSKDDANKLRKQAEEEKNLLAQLYTELIESRTQFTEAYDYAILPAEFTRSWRQWLFRPADNPRPSNIETEVLFCEHGQLNFDPNSPIDMSGAITVVKSSDWDILSRRYAVGPVIRLRAVLGSEGSHTFLHETPTCEACRLRLCVARDLVLFGHRLKFCESKTNFKETTITVLYHGAVPNDRTIMERPAPRPRQTIVRSSGVTRRSKRILDSNNSAEQKKINVTKEFSIKDLKILIQDTFNIPTLHQALYYNSKELENDETVSTLNLLVNDMVDLWRYPEQVDSGEEGTEDQPREGPGFTGTLLSGPGAMRDNRIPCPACTLLNTMDAQECEVCETPFS
jgi:hypothetical protein